MMHTSILLLYVQMIHFKVTLSENTNCSSLIEQEGKKKRFPQYEDKGEMNIKIHHHSE